MKTHRITFDNVQTGWHNALPLGNGRMGAMVFWDGDALHIALNHYDCYYRCVPARLQAGRTWADAREAVAVARGQADFAHTHYVRTLQAQPQADRPLYNGTGHPPGGELLVRLSDRLRDANTRLSLEIERGRVLFACDAPPDRLRIVVYVPVDAEGVVIAVDQSRPGLIGGISPAIAGLRGVSLLDRISQADGDWAVDRTLVACDGQAECGGDMDWMETAVVVPGSCAGGVEGSCGSTDSHVGGNTRRDGTAADVRLDTAGCPASFVAVASVRPGRSAALLECRRMLRVLPTLDAAHAAYWCGYWTSGIRIPDAMLETLWYLHVYLVGCDTGRGARRFEQARGLNGLWDIRRPSLWGSRWYWDVNIQSAYWHVFTANHIGQAKDFCDAYLTYAQDAERFAREAYGIDGWAIDYPHLLYNCIQPWCACFLWKYYAYTGDLPFLRERAYPVFLRQLDFIEQVAQPGADGLLHFDPDISPEQGPASRDSVATLASVRQLLRYAGLAAEHLGRPQAERDRIARLLSRLPEYPRTADGTRWKDSALAPDALPLRHPSLLMPIFPMEEVSAVGPAPMRDAARETLRYAVTHTEYGMFGFGWLAAAAARMGEGGSALRILYTQGIDLAMHTNGLFYEESERWINYCVITKPPLYLPAMTEPSGGIVEAVNLMLLQSIDGVVHIFPALPDGRDGLGMPRTAYREDWDDTAQGAAASGYGDATWTNCRFDGLLAPGGFEISAQRVDGRAVWLQVLCRVPGTVDVWLPAELADDGEAQAVRLSMQAGEHRVWGVPAEDDDAADENEALRANDVLLHSTRGSGRRIYLGENPDTAYHKAVDAFTAPFGFANELRPQWLPYVFDFSGTLTAGDGQKNYDDAYPPTRCMANGQLLRCTGPRVHGAAGYDARLGYGFADEDSLRVVDRGAPDSLRRDAVQGDLPNAFWIDLPKGRYDLLLICGDAANRTHTRVSLPQYGTVLDESSPPKGGFQYHRLPVSHTADGVLEIGLDSGGTEPWALCAVFICKGVGYL